MRFILAFRKKYFRAPPFAKKESGSPHRALNAVSVEVVGTMRRRYIARPRVPRSRWNMTPGGFRAVPGQIQGESGWFPVACADRPAGSVSAVPEPWYAELDAHGRDGNLAELRRPRSPRRYRCSLFRKLGRYGVL